MNDRSLKSKSVRLSQEQIEALERRAEEDKRDVSQVIRIALDEFFERQRALSQQPEAKVSA
jgi:predicted transcriptional regulator